jgi:uncharacterized protein with FMN-binding domain
MRRVAFAVLSTIAGLVGLLSFKTEATGSATASAAAVSTGQAATNSSTTSNTSHGTSAGTSATKSNNTSANTSSNKATSKATSKAASGSYTGSVVQTQYGPVQVRITVTNGKVTAATAVEYPSNDPRSAQINAYAVPYLQQESVGATSANSVQMVSGATYTSEGYLQSLQSALDKAGL